MVDLPTAAGLVVAALLGKGTGFRPRLRGQLHLALRWGEPQAERDDDPPVAD
jgi:hypothetical protein